MERPARVDLLQSVLDHAYNAVVVTTPELDPPGPQFVYVNRAFCEMTGYEADEVIGRTPRILQGPHTDRSIMVRLRGELERGEEFQGTAINYRKDGQPYVVQWNIAPIPGPEGSVEYYVSVQRDVTRQQEQESFARVLLDNLAEGVFGLDGSGAFTFANPAARQILGFPEESELLGRSAHALIHHSDSEGRPFPESRCPIAGVLQTAETAGPWRDWFWCKDGTGRPVEVFAAPLQLGTGSVFGCVVNFQEISDQVRHEDRLRHEATHDSLTELYNRSGMEEVLAEAAGRARRRGSELAMALIDIDRFKAINDELGHDIGDRLLGEIARVMDGELRQEDPLGRWGGEEFLLLMPGTSLEAAQRVAERLREAVAGADLSGGQGVTVSIGVGTLRPGESTEAVLRRVDRALYRAKEDGRNRTRLAGDPE